ncbi:hypothetical protein SprV_0301297700 [Sparganum proliferum]
MNRLRGLASTEGAPVTLKTCKFVGKATQSPADWSAALTPMRTPHRLDVSETQNPTGAEVTNSPICLNSDSKLRVEHPAVPERPLNLRMHTAFYCGGNRRTCAAASIEPPPIALRNFANSVVLCSNVISCEGLTERIVSVWADACPPLSTETNKDVRNPLFACICPAPVDAVAAVRENGELQCFEILSTWKDGLWAILPSSIDCQAEWIVLAVKTKRPVYCPLQAWKKHRLFIRNLNSPPRFSILPALPKQSLIWSSSCPTKLVQTEPIILSGNRCLLVRDHPKGFVSKHRNVLLKSAKLTHKWEDVLDSFEGGIDTWSETTIAHDVETGLNHVTCSEFSTLESLTVNMTRSGLLERPMVKTVVKLVEAKFLQSEPWKIAETRRLHRTAPTHLTRTSCPDGDRSTSALLMRSAKTWKTFWQCICLNACICVSLVTGKIYFFQMSSGDWASLFGVASAYLTVVSLATFQCPKRRGNF